MVITDRGCVQYTTAVCTWGGVTARTFRRGWRRAQDVTWAAAPIAPPREPAAALERAARGLAEELQGFERAEVVARDAAPQARRAVVAVRPRPLRLRNDEALARGARPLLDRRRLRTVRGGLARRGVVLVARALRPQGPQHVVERAEGAGERLRGDLRRAFNQRRGRGLRGLGRALAGGLDLLEVLLGVAPDLGRRARRDALGDLLPLAAVDVEALRNSSCSSAVQRPVALGMDLASRARAPPAALDGAFGPATVLDVNDAKSFFSTAACSAVPGAVVVL